MCVDTSALLRDPLSHPIIRAVHSHQPALQDGSLSGWRNLLRGSGGDHVRISVSVAVTSSACWTCTLHHLKAPKIKIVSDSLSAQVVSVWRRLWYTAYKTMRIRTGSWAEQRQDLNSDWQNQVNIERNKLLHINLTVRHMYAQQVMFYFLVFNLFKTISN